MKRVMLTAALATAGLLVAAGCSSGDSPSEPETPTTPDTSTSESATPETDTLQAPSAVAEAGVFKVCANMAYPPYEFFKEGTQEPDGSDVAVARAIGDVWGVPTEHLNVGFEGLIAAVNAGKCDIALSGMFPLPERLEAATFIIYQQNGSLILVPKGNPLNIQGLDDLSGKRVGVMLGSSHAKDLEDLNKELEADGKPQVEITTYAKDTDAPAALVAGKLDAYFAAGPSVEQRVVQAPDQLETVGELIKPEILGATARKDDAEMIDAVSAAVKEIYANGAMEQILIEWNMEKEALPEDMIGKVVE